MYSGWIFVIRQILLWKECILDGFLSSDKSSCENNLFCVDFCHQTDSHQERVHPALPGLLLQGQGPGLSCLCWRRGGRRRRWWRRRRGWGAGGWRGASWSSVRPILGATDNYRGLPATLYICSGRCTCLLKTTAKPIQSLSLPRILSS